MLYLYHKHAMENKTIASKAYRPTKTISKEAEKYDERVNGTSK